MAKNKDLVIMDAQSGEQLENAVIVFNKGNIDNYKVTPFAKQYFDRLDLVMELGKSGFVLYFFVIQNLVYNSNKITMSKEEFCMKTRFSAATYYSGRKQLLELGVISTTNYADFYKVSRKYLWFGK